ncbi:helix-turn-helix domain-containing protein [Rhodococcus sp. G-MC3]|uniref:TetR/AcrR family transcriptional regulator n=1 Tax=Rhodococcus sp. G-MC3 TaxID=3046209 RepID=UPI0024B9E8A0|nr:TetR/AcrR family transcriptional regulator [Rhodococcus sp. G-MC3]MDJ0392806.1 helix-turn-helix domain-containing protein [Rhodococcus sp. G-MC3]
MATDATSEQAPPQLGRRERNKRDKYQRIFEAASRLFVARGYSAVTTQEIAEAADVGTGTLFSYASSKAELLLMVMNAHMRVGTRERMAAASSEGHAADAIMGLLEPLIQISVTQPENTAVYQREVLFGAQGHHRSEALKRISEFEAAIGEVLRERGGLRTDIEPAGAARTIFSALHMEIIRLGLGRENAATLPDSLRRDVDLLLHGALGGRSLGSGTEGSR